MLQLKKKLATCKNHVKRQNDISRRLYVRKYFHIFLKSQVKYITEHFSELN